MELLKKIVLRGGLIIGILFLIYGSIFWTTNFLFSKKNQQNQYTLYTNSTLENSTNFLDQIDQRLRTCDLYDENVKHNIYIFSSEARFRFYAKIAGSGYPAQGFNMHIFNKIYISKTFIDRVHYERAAANKLIPYSAMEGNIQEVINHEIIHSFVYNKLGSRRASSLTTWKQEGFAEYAANLWSKKNDKTYNFENRIKLYRDSNFWQGDRFAFEYYESGILVEYLMDIKQRTFEQIMDENYTYEMAQNEINVIWPYKIGCNNF